MPSSPRAKPRKRKGVKLKPTDLKAKGVNVLTVDQENFRKKLAATPFYSDWKAKYGATAWDLLEKVSGKLG